MLILAIETATVEVGVAVGDATGSLATRDRPPRTTSGRDSASRHRGGLRRDRPGSPSWSWTPSPSTSVQVCSPGSGSASPPPRPSQPASASRSSPPRASTCSWRRARPDPPSSCRSWTCAGARLPGWLPDRPGEPDRAGEPDRPGEPDRAGEPDRPGEPVRAGRPAELAAKLDRLEARAARRRRGAPPSCGARRARFAPAGLRRHRAGRSTPVASLVVLAVKAMVRRGCSPIPRRWRTVLRPGGGCLVSTGVSRHRSVRR